MAIEGIRFESPATIVAQKIFEEKSIVKVSKRQFSAVEKKKLGLLPPSVATSSIIKEDAVKALSGVVAASETKDARLNLASDLLNLPSQERKMAMFGLLEILTGRRE